MLAQNLNLPFHSISIVVIPGIFCFHLYISKEPRQLELSVSVFSSGINHKGNSVIPESSTEEFECSSSSSSNPVSHIRWTLSSDYSNVEMTDEAMEVTTRGLNNGYDVSSRLTVKGDRHLNGQTLSCDLVYSGDIKDSRTYTIDVLCK